MGAETSDPGSPGASIDPDVAEEENMMEDKTSDLSSGSESPQENVERFENKNMIYIRN